MRFQKVIMCWNIGSMPPANLEAICLHRDLSGPFGVLASGLKSRVRSPFPSSENVFFTFSITGFAATVSGVLLILTISGGARLGVGVLPARLIGPLGARIPAKGRVSGIGKPVAAA